MTDKAKQVAVIGAGISGLACAFRLHQLGVPVIVLEASDEVGGLIGAIEKDGFLFESGPQSFQGTDFLLDLTSEVGIHGELLTAPPKAPRYVLKQGKLQKIPMSPPAMLSTPLLSFGSRMRIASEPLTRSHPPSQEESVAAFVRRKFGHEILEYLVSPFVSGVYAGDPEKLSLRAAFPTLDEWEREYGSVLRGAMKSRSSKKGSEGPPPLCSFTHGMQTLARAIAEKLGPKLRKSTSVAAIETTNGPGNTSFRICVTTKDSATQETIDANAVVMAVPAYTAAGILKNTSPAVAQMLSGIPYAGVAVVSAGYDVKQIAGPLDGFGVLIPRSEKLRTLGIVWNSALFEGRAPSGHFTITSFIGGATDPEIMTKTDSEITAICERDATQVLGIVGPPVTSVVWKHAKALPQYNLGHGHIVEAIREGEAAFPGLFFAGNYLQGPALSKCAEHGFKTADAAKTHIETRP